MENTEGVLENYLYLRHLPVYIICAAKVFMLFSVIFIIKAQRAIFNTKLGNYSVIKTALV